MTFKAYRKIIFTGQDNYWRCPDWETARSGRRLPSGLVFLFVFAFVLFSLVVFKGIVWVWYNRNQHVNAMYV